ncbi:MAG: DUF559 domain-containing protein [Acidimicrobiia bacterium]
MSSMAPSWSTLTTVPSTMSPSLNSRTVAAIAASKSSMISSGRSLRSGATMATLPGGAWVGVSAAGSVEVSAAGVSSSAGASSTGAPSAGAPSVGAPSAAGLSSAGASSVGASSVGASSVGASSAAGASTAGLSSTGASSAGVSSSGSAAVSAAGSSDSWATASTASSAAGVSGASSTTASSSRGADSFSDIDGFVTSEGLLPVRAQAVPRQKEGYQPARDPPTGTYATPTRRRRIRELPHPGYAVYPPPGEETPCPTQTRHGPTFLPPGAPATLGGVPAPAGEGGHTPPRERLPVSGGWHLVVMGRPKHTRKAAIHARTNRKEMSWSQARLWSGIRRKTNGARFRRQVPIGPWIADFASLNPRLVIEVDGPTDDFSNEIPRTEYLESQGFTVLRLDNDEIKDDINGVCALIELIVAELRDSEVRT